MSTPLWNEKLPGPFSPSAKSGSWKTVRGSPNEPRIGCCLSNGRTGHGYEAETGPAAASATTKPMHNTQKRPMAGSQSDDREPARLAGYRLGSREPLPEVPHQRLDLRFPHRAGEGEGTCGEHLRAGRGLVVGHLAGEAGAVEVRDLCEHLDVPRRARRGRVDLDPAAAETVAGAQAGVGEEPRRGRSAGAEQPRPAMAAGVVRPVLDAAQRGLGPPEIAPLGDAGHHGAVQVDLPEEVVGRQEHEVAAEVAVPGDDVVLVRRHVLVVTGEDDQVVR